GRDQHDRDKTDPDQATFHGAMFSGRSKQCRQMIPIWPAVISPATKSRRPETCGPAYTCGAPRSLNSYRQTSRPSRALTQAMRPGTAAAYTRPASAVGGAITGPPIARRYTFSPPNVRPYRFPSREPNTTRPPATTGRPKTASGTGNVHNSAPVSASRQASPPAGDSGGSAA